MPAVAQSGDATGPYRLAFSCRAWASRRHPLSTTARLLSCYNIPMDIKIDRPNPAVLCACGCGQSLLQFDTRGRKRLFLPSHFSAVQPHKRVVLACEQCGATFLRPQWHVRRVKHHFCSQPCAGAWSELHGTKRGDRNGHYHTITVPCAGCGAPVSKASSLIYRRQNCVYCPDCPLPKRRGARGFYVGYPKEFSPALRTRIRKRDGHLCRWCKRPQSETGTLHVHHIDYDKQHNSPSNLISLCRDCHGQTNFATALWQARLEALVV